ncbi:MAG: ATP-binding protein [Gammaproteobacteria bacterium]|nr:ATP-binding protein [Gammaproteobacteria bacterium]
MRFFNNAGPVNCKKHYCLPPLQRFDIDEILLLIEQEKYFVLHAPRQVGKTTWLLALQEHLNREGQYRCLYFNVEVAQAAREDIEQGMRAILAEMAEWAVSTLDDAYIESIWRDVLAQNGGNVALNKVLTLWARQSDKPLVIFIDEIDSLTGDTLISVLRQLRSGYARRPADFPQSVVLCGVRDVRDYRLHTDSGKAAVSGGSPFNIKAESLRMDNFKRTEMENLYRQHTQETGQVFSAQTLALAWELTQGQPWLINALAHETCFKMQTGRDRTENPLRFTGTDD